MLKNFILVGLGGALGTMLRYAVQVLVSIKPFPLATFIVNTAGSFIIGAVLALSIKNESFSTNWKLFLTTGICGGFTTFSAFSAENLQLLQNGKLSLAVVYIISSIFIGIAAAWAGFKLFNIN